jgi:hypothetical protein
MRRVHFHRWRPVNGKWYLKTSDMKDELEESGFLQV